MVENLAVSAEDIRGVALIPGLGRSPGGGHQGKSVCIRTNSGLSFPSPGDLFEDTKF